VSRKNIYYRPIGSLLKELLLLPLFIESICFSANYNSISGEISDLYDGRSYKQKNDRMNLNFEHKKKINNFDANCLKVNIVINMFYDGCNLFNNANSQFHALIIQILNLHPSIRICDGIGSFLIAMHNAYTMDAKVSSKEDIKGTAERMMFQNFFNSELKTFEEGVLWKIKDRQMFIQVALLNQILDTKEICKLCKVNGQGSNGCCPICSDINGVYSTVLDKVIFTGHRCLLPLNNQLRLYGQSNKCCPLNYHILRGMLYMKHPM